jgi:hypothetical protein
MVAVSAFAAEPATPVAATAPTATAPVKAPTKSEAKPAHKKDGKKAAVTATPAPAAK